MLLSCGVQRVLVCAPSNAAVDEVVSRLSTQGFIGTAEKGDEDSILNGDPETQAEGLLLRIGSLDYEPSPAVLRHTLDERLAETMAGNRERQLQDQIEMASDLLLELSQEA